MKDRFLSLLEVVVNKVNEELIPDLIKEIRKNRERQTKCMNLWGATIANNTIL